MRNLGLKTKFNDQRELIPLSPLPTERRIRLEEMRSLGFETAEKTL
jgi:hypothetical protein